MVGIQGLGGVPEPKSERPAATRNDRDRNANAVENSGGGGASSDNVVISSEAQAAAQLARVVQSAQTQPEIRADRVDAARERLAQGSFRDPEVVSQVADRLLKFLG